ncbi:hypothetical protein CLOSTHATH_00876 [Hungatella hathewayi DSM 13479]|uniref:Uncharacterized protein n=1 Tax=Hungatella hathewayi DSM 13479 TaxID=566550 RepID=D3ABA5_9FIRM|nr:hypothetical protein CLOSTHATH_00876 [Hungatella hathewayi DSM 13479]
MPVPMFSSNLFSIPGYGHKKRSAGELTVFRRRYFVSYGV